MAKCARTRPRTRRDFLAHSRGLPAAWELEFIRKDQVSDLLPQNPAYRSAHHRTHSLTCANANHTLVIIFRALPPLYNFPRPGRGLSLTRASGWTPSTQPKNRNLGAGPLAPATSCPRVGPHDQHNPNVPSIWKAVSAPAKQNRPIAAVRDPAALVNTFHRKGQDRLSVVVH